jgi:hypothetical protein
MVWRISGEAEKLSEGFDGLGSVLRSFGVLKIFEGSSSVSSDSK